MEEITAEDVRLWVEERKEELLESFNKCEKEIPMLFKDDDLRREHVWFAGCYLGYVLGENNIDETTTKDAGFIHGQRSFFGNPYKLAAILCNQIFIDGKLKDKPGIELAEKLNNEYIRLEDSTIKIYRENYL